MILDHNVTSFAKVRGALSLPLAPLQYMVSWPAQFIDNIKNNMVSHETLVEENLRLKAEQLLLKAQLQRQLSIESENAQLKALAQSSHQTKGKTLIAQLLAVETQPFLNEVVINKGIRDDVYIGQPVLDADGVMGQITQVGVLTSRALLVNDIHSGISVQSARNGVRAIANGEGLSGKLRLLYVSHTTDIKIGDIFVTSGLGQYYPEGYPVGKVIEVNKDTRQQFSSILLEPSAHLASSREVLLVWYERKT